MTQNWPPTGVEDWHLIGGSGEPAFQNSWVNYGGVEVTARYYRDPYGIVRLTGLVKSGVINTTIFTLPAGYRVTTGTTRFPVMSAGALGYMRTDNTGNIVLETGSNTWVDLSSVQFRAEI